jgi:hypothetical protein
MINSPNLLKRLEAIPPSPLQRLLRFDLYFSAPVQTLIFFVVLVIYLITPIPFLVPIILSLHIPLGAML